MTNFEGILKRQSCRKYEDEGLDSGLLEQIRKDIKGLEPLIPGIKVHLTVVEASLFNEVAGGLFLVKAPYYLMITSEEKEGYSLNAGYIGEKALLYLNSLGLGTCWLGGAKEKKEANYKLPLVAAIAFGYGQGEVYRETEALETIKRMPLEKWASGDWEPIANILEGVRIAPSAMNRQPWRCQCEGNRVRWFTKKNLPIFSSVIGKMDEVSMGIGFYHLEVFAEHYGKKVLFEKENLLSGIGYVLTTDIN